MTRYKPKKGLQLLISEWYETLLGTNKLLEDIVNKRSFFSPMYNIFNWSGKGN
jgi:hypothetical protein